MPDLIRTAPSGVSSKGIEVPFGSHGIPSAALGVVLAIVLFTLFGLGVDAIVGDQTQSVVGLLVYLFVIDTTLRNLTALHSWATHRPGAANDALTQWSQDHTKVLRPALVLILYAYAAALLAIGATATVGAMSSERDRWLRRAARSTTRGAGCNTRTHCPSWPLRPVRA